MSLNYEWDVETVADGDSEDYEDGEVIDHAHAETYAEARAWAAALPPEPGTRYAFVLVRDDDAGRAWAQVEDGKLPAHFTDGDGRDVARVPKRYHQEVERFKD